jgi:hypothetical protein
MREIDRSQGAQFRFNRNANIGEAGAEDDDEFLFQSFFETGDYRELRSTASPKRIVVGRTGSGKTALLRNLSHNEDHVIEIDPENLSLNFIANNDVLRFFEGIGVKLDLFYALLWKHMLAVELIRSKYQLTTEEKTNSWIGNVRDSLRKKDQTKERALTYLKDWGDKFWIETDHRVKELTTKLAGELSAESGLKVAEFALGAKAAASMSAEQKLEVLHRGQRVVNAVQVRELSDVIRFLNEDVFVDSQKPYFITIDKLDENWVEDKLRFRLIRALIEAVRAFQKVQNVKVIVALRHDLLRKVFEETADAGFQEEKYEASFLRLRWTRSQIEELVDRRVAVLVREQYTSRPIKLRDLFPERVNGRTFFIDYFIQRIALRPRDAILFVNECISRSESQGQVKAATIFEAERDYSRLRRKSLIYEWQGLYPSLENSLKLIERMPAEFRLSAVSGDNADQVIEALASLDGEAGDPCIRAATRFINSETASKHGVIAEIFRALFDVGAVGLRLEGGSGPIWSQESTAPPASQLKPSTKALVHPMFWQALATQFNNA